jgi:hypothetical protein
MRRKDNEGRSGYRAALFHLMMVHRGTTLSARLSGVARSKEFFRGDWKLTLDCLASRLKLLNRASRAQKGFMIGNVLIPDDPIPGTGLRDC